MDGAIGADGSPLIMAARDGHAGVVTLLRGCGAAHEQAVASDENTLIEPSGHGRLDVVRLLISRGADVLFAAARGNGRAAAVGSTGRSTRSVTPAFRV